jgi:hypothetical protein
MSSILAHFPPEVLNKVISLSVIQNLLVTLTPERIREVREACRGLLGTDRFVPVSELVHCFFIAAQCQPRRVPFLSTIIRDLAQHGPVPAADFSAALLSSFTRPAGVYSQRCFFLRELMIAEVLAPREIVSAIRVLFEFQPSRPERAFIAFCWFAPEVEHFDPPLFDRLLSDMAKSNNLPLALSNFLALFDYFKADDWKTMKEAASFGFLPDWAVVAIARDDTAALRRNKQFNPTYHAPPCVYDCSIVLDGSTPMLHVAAYFGSVNCFDYLLSKGANPTAESRRELTLTQYAIAGGNADLLRRVLEMPLDKKGIFAAAAEFHQNVLADYFLVNLAQCSQNPWLELFRASAKTNNLMLLLKCLEHGIALNEGDTFRVCLTFRKLRFASQRKTAT